MAASGPLQMSNTERKRLLRCKAAATAGNAERQTAFRRAEKRYTTRVPPPDYSAVIDLHGDGIDRFAEHVTVHDLLFDLYDLSDFGSHREGSCGRAYRLKSHPGAILVPGALSSSVQRRLVKECLRHTARPPNASNLDAHYLLPDEGIWNAHAADQSRDEHKRVVVQPKHLHNKISVVQAEHSRKLIQNEPGSLTTALDTAVAEKPPPAPSTSVVAETASALLYKLRWTNIGLLYHWSSKSYHFEHVLGSDLPGMIPVPESLSSISRHLLRSVPSDLIPTTQQQSWRDFQPEAGIINYYQLKSTLMGHIDHSELVEDAPLVSLSIGHAAVFLLGGKTRDEEPTAIMLRSGDALIMSGECRRAYHGVPRIVEGSLPDYLRGYEHWPDDDADKDDVQQGEDWRLFGEYMATTRINVNVRQVFPAGFLEETRAARAHQLSLQES